MGANPRAPVATTSARWRSRPRPSNRLDDAAPSIHGARESRRVPDDPEAIYRQTTPGSRAIHQKAVAVMPGGTTRTTTYFDPYPLYIERGEGCRVRYAGGSV